MSIKILTVFGVLNLIDFNILRCDRQQLLITIYFHHIKLVDRSKNSPRVYGTGVSHKIEDHLFFLHTSIFLRGSSVKKLTELYDITKLMDCT